MSSLFVRAMLAFLALPGVVAFVVPLLLADGSRFAYPVGLAPLLLGVLLLLWWWLGPRLS